VTFSFSFFDDDGDRRRRRRGRERRGERDEGPFGNSRRLIFSLRRRCR
jgi:hypothetical protein